jgi:hypothetical protein
MLTSCVPRKVVLLVRTHTETESHNSVFRYILVKDLPRGSPNLKIIMKVSEIEVSKTKQETNCGADQRTVRVRETNTQSKGPRP